MPIRIFNLKFDPARGFIDEESVNKFLLSRKLLDMKKEFFLCEGTPYWSILIEYEEVLPPGERVKPPQLNEWQHLLLARLKEWRKAKAEEHGIPVYLVATNSELKSVVLSAPETLESLRAVRGFGSKKVEKYGKEIIDLVKGFFNKP